MSGKAMCSLIEFTSRMECQASRISYLTLSYLTTDFSVVCGPVFQKHNLPVLA